METKIKIHKSFYKNRKEAGKTLALRLRKYKNSNTLILALPRGGVPVAAEISHVLDLPLEILAVRKIGVPIFSELAAGAICENDKPYFSENLLLRLGFKPDELQPVVEQETRSIKKQIQLFRQGRPLPSLSKKNIILVDDGLATGATMLAAIHYLNKKSVSRIIVAVPVGAASSLKSIRAKADEVISPLEPEDLASVSEYYEDFSQVEDQEALSLLKAYRNKMVTASPAQKSIEAQMISLEKIGDLDTLIQSLQDVRIVMLGEASHGTHEYYQLRATISKRLIEDYGFSFIAVEGDWPDAYRLHRYIHDEEKTTAARTLLQNHRWPTWMWANEEVARFAEWMRGRSAGFFGLDVYSLFESIEDINRYLRNVDPSMAQQILKNYSCFDPFLKDEVAYARSLTHYPQGCEQEALNSLKALLEVRLRNDEELFSAQQNARIVANAESYYRAMIKGDKESWNVRDNHMHETLTHLLERFGEGSKAIVWAHNTHIGDYRATDMAAHGHINIGGLAREKFGPENVRLVGFGSYQGKVLAGSFWGAKEEIMDLPPARENSFEWHCHQVALKNKLNKFHLPLRELKDPNLSQTLLHRAVGVVYDPTQEYRGNYVPSEIADRYDDFIFIDRTHALRSLHAYADKRELPETWPSGE